MMNRSAARLLKRLGTCRRGSVAITTAVSLSVMMLAVGLGFDLSRAFLAHARLAYALDQAGLAAGSFVGTSQAAMTLGRSYFNANFNGNPGAVLTAYNMTISNSVVTVTGSAQLNTTILALTGQPTMTVHATSVVNRAGSNLEVALVLDNTASLNCCTSGTGQTNFQQLQAAATQLATSLFGSATTGNPGLRVAVVPYTGAANAGSVAPSLVSGKPPLSSSWTGCLVERYSTFSAATIAYAGSATVYNAVAADLDTAVGTGWYLQKYQNTGGNTNTGCPSAITPLTNNLAPVLAAINAMDDAGGSGTVGSVGMAWGYRMLSPQGPFTGVETVNCWATQSCASQTPGWQKVVVLMTDGVNAPEGHPYDGFGTESGNAPGTHGCSATQNYNSGSCLSATNAAIVAAGGAPLIDAQEEAVCDALRAKGVIIFSVFLDSNTSPGAAIGYCAGTTPGDGTSSAYFLQASNVNLIATFNTIATRLNNLRVSQ